MRRIHPGEENLKAVSRPFRGAAPLVGRAEIGAALRPKLVEEEPCRQTRGVNGSSSGSREVVGRDKQQIRIDGTHANGVRTPDLKSGAVDVFKRDGLGQSLITEPISVQDVRRQDGVIIHPTVQSINWLR